MAARLWFGPQRMWLCSPETESGVDGLPGGLGKICLNGQNSGVGQSFTI